MKINTYYSLSIYFILLLSPLCAISCPYCNVEPDRMDLISLYQTDGLCYEVESFCRDAQGNEITCPTAMPADCLHGNEAPQVCFRVRYWCLFGDFSPEDIGMEIAGQQFNFWRENMAPGWPGTTYVFCADSDEISDFYTPGLAFPNNQLPTVNLTIDEESYATPIIIIPSGGVVIGDLVSDENYQWSESFAVQTKLGFKSCLGDPQQSYTGSIGIDYTESTGWSVGGTISLGGQEQVFSGSFSASNSWANSSGVSYQTSVSGYLPLVEEEDCEEYGDSRCDHCCFHLNAALEQEIHQYEMVQYSCNGAAQVQHELVPVIADYGAILFMLGGFIACPSFPLYLHPRKLYGDGNRSASPPAMSITVDEFIDFDYYTLIWYGPDGFSAENQTLLENLEPGEYCYTLTHCGCEGPVDKGCLVLCPGASPVSGWYHNEEKELYCREFVCDQTSGVLEECVNAAACSEWAYNENNNECFREICYEGEALFVEANAPYSISYEYDNNFCRAFITCLEGGEEIIVEMAPKYSEAFFDENEGSCYRYVLCGEEIAAAEYVGINDIAWEYNEYSGCIGKILCNESSSYDGEVSGADAGTYFGNWSYDEFNGCLRDVTCSYNNAFQQNLHEASRAEEFIFWEYDDNGNSCLGTVSCDGEITEIAYSLPDFGGWDENAALYNVECVREAFCGDPFHFGRQFEDYGHINVSFQSGPCAGGYKPCYIQIECDGDIVVGDDLVGEIPCDESCGGNSMRQRIAALLAGTQITDCGLQFLPDPENGMVLLNPQLVEGEEAERIIVVEMGTGRIVQQLMLSTGDYQGTRALRLPGKGVYALISYTRTGHACYSKIISH